MKYRHLYYEYGGKLHLEEWMTIIMAVIFNIFILFSHSLGKALDIFAVNSLFVVSILSVAALQSRLQWKGLAFVRDWYVLGFMIAFFTETGRLVPLVNPHDLDPLTIFIDRLMFLGHDPTVLLESVTFPILTDILQVLYTSFYFVPFILCVIIYCQKNEEEYHTVASTIMLGFYVSYLAYFITPVLGPRYTLSDFQTFPLTGAFVFEYLRPMLDNAEGFMRNCAPSAHTLVTLLTILLAKKYSKKYYYIVLTWGSLIIYSTVYLRYHYVIDIVYGAVLSVIIYQYAPEYCRKLILSLNRVTQPADRQREAAGH